MNHCLHGYMDECHKGNMDKADIPKDAVSCHLCKVQKFETNQAARSQNNSYVLVRSCWKCVQEGASRS